MDLIILLFLNMLLIIFMLCGYVIVLLIINLYFIVDMVNLWNVNFLMCLILNINL